MKSILRKEVIIGLLVIVAMLILFFGINFLKGVNLFKAANYYYSVYNNVEGLAQSAPVNLNGFKVGIVRSIQYDYNHPGNVIVEMSLDKSLKLPTGTKATLSADLLGTASITLELANSPTFYNVGDTVPGAVKPSMMAGLSENLILGNGFDNAQNRLFANKSQRTYCQPGTSPKCDTSRRHNHGTECDHEVAQCRNCKSEAYNR